MQTLVPYLRLMRLNKPIGIWLVFFPAAWAVLLVPGDKPWLLLAAMLLGAVLIRSAGCIVNDLIDRKLDATVARTKDRPLASGAVSPRQAIMLLLVLLVDGLILARALPPLTVKLALVALPFIALYPWMKRITFWPQAFLGLTFNFGALIGWAATGTPLSQPAYLLYAACFFWTLGYDTLYAVQDMGDDQKAGVKSTALFIGTGKKLGIFTGVCYGLMLLLFFFAVRQVEPFKPVFYGFFALAIGHTLWQARTAATLTPSDPRGGMLFRSNQWLGSLLLLALALERLFPHAS